jgi:hypothetical protein
MVGLFKLDPVACPGRGGKWLIAVGYVIVMGVRLDFKAWAFSPSREKVWTPGKNFRVSVAFFG